MDLRWIRLLPSQTVHQKTACCRFAPKISSEGGCAQAGFERVVGLGDALPSFYSVSQSAPALFREHGGRWHLSRISSVAVIAACWLRPCTTFALFAPPDVPHPRWDGLDTWTARRTRFRQLDPGLTLDPSGFYADRGFFSTVDSVVVCGARGAQSGFE
ncbi:hypothetical protein B0H17DRAFT_1097057 [Mycena rosella]|uniref:Uncharacterized protein n=1 Tax=Mycena rosella TaxID=1033263 RepID=A0AAD7CQN0_MYCRO|nr:hypothetical protein B0H17DRAFT_1097057 [Mycena rosella]